MDSGRSLFQTADHKQRCRGSPITLPSSWYFCVFLTLLKENIYLSSSIKNGIDNMDKQYSCIAVTRIASWSYFRIFILRYFSIKHRSLASVHLWLHGYSIFITIFTSDIHNMQNFACVSDYKSISLETFPDSISRLILNSKQSRLETFNYYR